MTPFVPVFIFLLWFILFGRKAIKGIPLNREERVLAWIGIILLIVSVIPQYFQLFDVKPSIFIPYLADIERAILVALPIIAILIVVAVINHQKKKIRQSLTKCYHKKLERKIRKELENVATTKNLAFPHQLRSDVLSKLADRVSSDIVTMPIPEVYLAQPMPDKRDGSDVYLAKLTFTIPMDSAKALADKMTELSKDVRFRRRKRFLRFCQICG